MRDKIRVSIGTAATIGLDHALLKVRPKTAYLLTYHGDGCMANCQFCAQARESTADPNRLARGLYLPYSLEKTIAGLSEAVRNGHVRRVCLQTINYPGMFRDVTQIVGIVKAGAKVPITVSRHPMSYDELDELQHLGVDRVVIPLDAVSENLFSLIKGRKAGSPYSWEGHWRGLEMALDVFGRRKVGTHLMLGLGEREEEAIEVIDKLCGKGIDIGLFAHVPTRGTPLSGLPRPPISSYRRVQLAYYLIREGMCDFADFAFEDGRLIRVCIEDDKLHEAIEIGNPFITTGCPDCNRPYSTEGPLGPVYNYASPPAQGEIMNIKRQLELW